MKKIEEGHVINMTHYFKPQDQKNYVAQLEHETLSVLHEALVNYYLSTKNFKALKDLIKGNTYILSEEPQQWVWVMNDKDGNWYIPLRVYECFHLSAELNASLMTFNSEDDKQRTIDWEVDCAIDFYLEEKKEHLLLLHEA